MLLADCMLAIGCCCGTAALAKTYGVLVGAYPSYNDHANFGCSNMMLGRVQIFALMAYQLDVCLSVYCAQGMVRYVKLHDPLYNQAARDPILVAWIADSVAQFCQMHNRKIDGTKLAIMGF